MKCSGDIVVIVHDTRASFPHLIGKCRNHTTTTIYNIYNINIIYTMTK